LSSTPNYDSNWEWGWKTPLLLFSGAVPAPVTEFLASPLTDFDLESASNRLNERLSELKTSRIGIRFERIQEALMRSHPETTTLRSGIQIPGVTEIDLLQKLRSLPDTTIHWEVAVKFYLAIDAKGSRDADRWIGPSQKDSLGIKMRTIWDRQLTVLKDPKVRASLGIPETEKILALPKVHGVLFSPWPSQKLEFPEGVSPDCQRGVWVHESDTTKFLASLRAEHGSALRIFILQDRKEWIRDHTREEWLTKGEGLPEVLSDELSLKNYFNYRLKTLRPSDSQEKEPFQGMLLLDGRELRFFCVPDTWAKRAEGALECLKARSRIIA